MSNQVPPGPGQPPYQGSEPPYEPYPQAPGVPPPPGPYPSGAEPPYGQPSYGSEPSYGSPQQYGPAPQPYGPPSEPSYGPGPGQEQPSYGYDPARPGHGPVPGYQPGQGQYPPQGGYVPSYTGGPYPAAPKSGSGGKIVAIVAAAVVVVGLVVGGVVLLTKDGDPVADPSTSASRGTSSTKPTTTARPTPTTTPDELDYDEARALAEAAFPPAAGYEFDFCSDGFSDYDAEVGVSCFNGLDPFERFEIYVYPDTSSAMQALRDDWSDFEESPWAHGTDFIDDAPGTFYEVVRCYADAPVCVEVFEDTKEQAETALSHLAYLDAAGIAALNDRLTGGV